MKKKFFSLFAFRCFDAILEHADEPLTEDFERIHPFQDGNGRVGRLLMFKECLAQGVVPFIVTDEIKMFYYRGLQEWGHINEYLTDTCLAAQDDYKVILDRLQIAY